MIYWAIAISPCFGKGSGLKPRGQLEYHCKVLISPCFGKGSGLKLRVTVPVRDDTGISPCFGKGSGLKHRYIVMYIRFQWHISPCFGKGSGLKPVHPPRNAHLLLGVTTSSSLWTAPALVAARRVGRCAGRDERTRRPTGSPTDVRCDGEIVSIAQS